MNRMDRFCIFKKDNLPLVLALDVDSGLVVTIDFKLYSPDKKRIVESWKFTNYGDENIKYQFKTSSLDLDRHFLVWQIIACSKDYDIADGVVKFEIRQLDFICITNVPTNWKMSKLMPVHTKMPQKKNDALMFVGHAPENKNPFE